MADSGHNKPLIANESLPADQEPRENCVKDAHCKTKEVLRSIADMCEELKKELAETEHQHKGTWWLTDSIYELEQTRKEMERAMVNRKWKEVMARISRIKAQEESISRTKAEEKTVSHSEAKKGMNIAGSSTQSGDTGAIDDREPGTKRQRTDTGP
jgi:chromosome segregation ATPase